MTEKPYNWSDGAELAEHSHRKHKIVREYFSDYLHVRCRLPQQSKFRLAVVDAFAGGGRYACGTPGSPIIFIQELERVVEALNVTRATNGMATLDVEALLIFNDRDVAAIAALKQVVAPLEAQIKSSCSRLHLRVEYRNDTFENVYPDIKALLRRGQFSNVLFNLDQCGHTHVATPTLTDILLSFRSAEIFYTFVIDTLVNFLNTSKPAILQAQLSPLGIAPEQIISLQSAMLSRQEWLGAAERIVFDVFKGCAPFVSPFSINNPEGWRYWLIHFANSPRARQVYNNVLHDNSSMQAHFGRSGLDMLVYDPRHDAPDLFLFDGPSRQRSMTQLLDDIPRLVSARGDVISVEEFYQAVYNVTPAHSDDIHAAIADHPDMEVITPTGGERRRANTITIGDTIRLKNQRSFFPMFGRTGHNSK
ncbi:three-Cys-motif partner protein TcmP [Hyphomicrobium sp. CS1BSMeth3]|uniref:three-Cys-motif partner protein TcmP n=1 Tax=Hyphomicrobium sp. CS1BSMeth3 TaxID=1892844 RepID=UPI000931F13F|nr:three-Cys-motif partner protein TcmP [Hyphomicrobium sp. CS1BSMeth3]